MERVRTTNHDVIRQGDSISIVERKSGAGVATFAIPCDETRKALLKLLAAPCGGVADVAQNATTADVTAAAVEPEKPKTTTKNKKKRGQ